MFNFIIKASFACVSSHGRIYGKRAPNNTRYQPGELRSSSRDPNARMLLAFLKSSFLTYSQEGGFYGEEYDLFFRLLNAKDKKERYLHSAVFCRATPSLKPWVVRLMQYKQPENVWEHFSPGRNYVLAIGGIIVHDEVAVEG